MEKYSIETFLQKTKQKDQGGMFFEQEGERMLEINLDGDASQMAWIRMGKMISYRGEISFKREGMLEHGLGKALKKKFTGEGSSLMKAEGKGKVYVADFAKKISVLELTDDTIFVNGNDLLAFDPTLSWDIKMMKRMSSMMAGGLFNVEVSGSGMVAITSHGTPMTLEVTADNPIFTDPNATVAWSGDLETSFKTDVSLGTFFGRGSGESIQMKFEGEGFVVVQPFEEIYTM
jgi:uncharacterized protein (AIM24 family)